MSLFRHATAGVIALASIILFAGCTTQQNAFTDLQGGGEARDELPQLGVDAYDRVDESTSRLVGEHDGTSLWLAEGTDASRICLIADDGDGKWIVGCGGAEVKVGGIAGSFALTTPGVR